jgi:putative flippase GtrA
MSSIRNSTIRQEGSYFLTFAAVGASGMIVDLATFLLALSLFPPALARAAAIWVAMTWNFGGNRALTFRNHGRGDFWTQYVSYCCSCLLGASINWVVSLVFWEAVPQWSNQPWLAPLLGVAAGMGFNYTLCRLWVFRTSVVTETAVTTAIDQPPVPAPHAERFFHPSPEWIADRQPAVVESWK